MIWVYESTLSGEIDYQKQHQSGLDLVQFHFGYLPTIIKSAKGKPKFENEHLFFSVSHSECKIVVAISLSEVGIDVQKIKTISPRIMERKFHSNENASINDDEDFTLIWCAKESYGKYKGDGILYNSQEDDFSSLLTSEKAFINECNFTTIKQGEYVYCLCAAKEDEIVWVEMDEDELIKKVRK